MPLSEPATGGGAHSTLEPATAPALTLGSAGADHVMLALEALMLALQENIEIAHRAGRRAADLLDQRRLGRSYREIVPQGGEPLIIEMMRESVTRLGAAASRLQHAKARALYDEGLTMEQIGRLFGISHQRVSAMLKRARAEGPVSAGDGEVEAG